MRFNAKELAYIAQERSSYFDFEGVLFIKEKSDGIFKKNKVYVERFFRLKGNLLFYFKTRDKSSDVSGLYILERCCVQLEDDELTEDSLHLYCFSIVFEAETPLPASSASISSPSAATASTTAAITDVIFLGSASESERDRWIELIHISSYECMRFQLQHLQDRLMEEERKAAKATAAAVAVAAKTASSVAATTAAAAIAAAKTASVGVSCNNSNNNNSGIGDNSSSDKVYNRRSKAAAGDHNSSGASSSVNVNSNKLRNSNYNNREVRVFNSLILDKQNNSIGLFSADDGEEDEDDDGDDDDNNDDDDDDDNDVIFEPTHSRDDLSIDNDDTTTTHQSIVSVITTATKSLSMLENSPSKTTTTTTTKLDRYANLTYVKLGISCSNLPLEQFSRQPDTFATIHYINQNAGPRQRWRFYGKTEIVEKCRNPVYAFLIGVKLDDDVVNTQTKLRLSLHSVRERMTNTTIIVGTAEFDLLSILQSSTMSIAFILRSPLNTEVGTAVVRLWINNNHYTNNNNNNIANNNNNNNGNNNNNNNNGGGGENMGDGDFGNPFERAYNNDDDDDDGDDGDDDISETVNDEEDDDGGDDDDDDSNFINFGGNDNNSNNNNNRNIRSNDKTNKNNNKKEDEYEPSSAVLVAYKRYSISGLSKRRRPRRKTYIRPQVRPGLDLIITRNTIIKTFRFPLATQLMGDSGIVVNECMSEFRYGFSLPIYILEFLMDTEIEAIYGYDQLGTLPSLLDNQKRDLIDYLFNTVFNYQQHLKYLKANPDVYFKPSIKKTHKEVEFIPTNLHIQSMFVSKKLNEDKYRYDFITVGAFTALSQKFKHGGLKRLISLFNQFSTKIDKTTTRHDYYNDILTQMDKARSDIAKYTDILCAVSIKGKVNPVLQAYKFLEQAIAKLLRLCTSSAVSKSLREFYGQQPKNMSNTGMVDEVHFRDCNLNEPSPAAAREHQINWAMLGGVELLRGKSIDPWDKPRSNMEISLQCLKNVLEACFKAPERERTFWLDSISPHAIRLKRCAEILFNRYKLGPNFIIMQEVSNNLPLYHTIKYRRDIVFTQALTSAVLGFLIRLSAFISTSVSIIKRNPSSATATSKSTMSVVSAGSEAKGVGHLGHQSTLTSWLYQCMTIGHLMQVESLLSCYGDEIGMMEDEWVALNDLRKVKLKLAPVSSRVAKKDVSHVLEKMQKKYFPPDVDADLEVVGRRTKLERPRSVTSLKIYAKKLKPNEFEITDIEFETDDSDMQVKSSSSLIISPEPTSSTLSSSAATRSTTATATQPTHSTSTCDNTTTTSSQQTPKKASNISQNATSSVAPPPTTSTATSSTTYSRSHSTVATKKTAKSSDKKSSKLDGHRNNLEDPRNIEYLITGTRDNPLVTMYIPEDVYEFMKGDLVNCLKLRSLVDRNTDAIFMHESSIEFTMVPVWFTMGINENATIAEKFFSTSFQEEINKENYSRLNDYFKKYSALPENVNSGNVRSIDGMMQLLQTNIYSTKKNKNVDIIQIAGDICRALNGARFTSCKSAKDRTSMSVTLEQVKLLRREHDLAQDAFIHALDSIRSEGVRRDNTLKNTGVRKYAFNTIQIVSLPKMYRPPKGTFGNAKT